MANIVMIFTCRNKTARAEEHKVGNTFIVALEVLKNYFNKTVIHKYC